MKSAILFLLFMISTSIHADNRWDAKREVNYRGSDSLGFILLKDGLSLEISYNNISEKEVRAWPKGKILFLVYKIGVGSFIFDPESGKEMRIGMGLEKEKHPLDLLLDDCLAEDSTTGGMVNCLKKATISWDRQLNASYKKLMKQLKQSEKTVVKKAQRAWIKYKDAQTKALSSIYAEGGSMRHLSFASKVMNITREQAKLLESCTGIW